MRYIECECYCEEPCAGKPHARICEGLGVRVPSLLAKLYPEGSAEARFKIRGVRRILFYCNRDGLFMVDPFNI